MPKLAIAPLARQDIKDIGRYTQNTWGVKQRDLYLGALDKVINGLLEGRGMGRDRSDIKAGLLSHLCNKHMIFFRRDNQGNVEVLRVLGQAMDFERHL